MNINHSVKGIRIVAAIIDLIIIFFLVIFINIFMSVMAISSIGSNRNINIIVTVLSFVLLLLLFFFYYTLIPFLSKGKTLGKLIVGIKVVSIDYDKPSFLQLFIRNIYFYEIIAIYVPILVLLLLLGVNSIIIVFLIGLIVFGLNISIFIMILATEDERGFHDHIAKTYVVSKHYDIDKIAQVNALERQNMDWAIFDDNNIPTQKDQDEINVSSESDQIEILKSKK